MSKKIKNVFPTANKVTHNWEYIDPVKAKAILNHVHPLQKGRHGPLVIEAMARQMKNNEWDTDVVQTVSIDTNGNLVNGYHRMNAVIESGRTLPFLVVRGVSPDSFSNYDNAYSRTLAQRVGMEPDNVAVINAVLRIVTYPQVSMRPSTHVINTVWDAIKPYYDMLSDVVGTTRKQRVTNAPTRSGIILAMKTFPDKALEYASNYKAIIVNGPTTQSMGTLYRNLMEERVYPIKQTLLAYTASIKPNNQKFQFRNMPLSIKAMQEASLSDVISAINGSI